MSRITTYYLYEGSSSDGRGPSSYVGKTDSVDTARAHLKRISLDPYSNGYVRWFDDKAEHLAHYPEYLKA